LICLEKFTKIESKSEKSISVNKVQDLEKNQCEKIIVKLSC